MDLRVPRFPGFAREIPRAPAPRVAVAGLTASGASAKTAMSMDPFRSLSDFTCPGRLWDTVGAGGANLVKPGAPAVASR
ncbi:hypothetical protein SAMN05216252_102104 [Actinacidiphila glaucinigra]|uniref:Uncharacterized protein n=1 Tax=Actinacidiphila glaucinigra TaxID=235986 RepID=A0A239ARC2_9ACTN|nr:hypothetical protein SAMN05216252_102104 [Actinacidiphila glaucinigra]